MMKSHIFLFYLITVPLGIFSSYTDIKYHKIKNLHLAFANIFTLLIYLYLINSGIDLFNRDTANCIIAGVLIGVFLFIFEIWKAGDSKLFITYALILPVAQIRNITVIPVLSLFFNFAVIGFIVVIFMTVWEFLKNRKPGTWQGLSRADCGVFFDIFTIIFSVNWIVAVLTYKMAVFGMSPFFILPVILLIYYGIFMVIFTYRRYSAAGILFVLSIILRLFLYPDFVLSGGFVPYFEKIFFLSIILFSIRCLFRIEHKKKSIAFAPFMFAGILLMNTDFLTIFMSFIKRIFK